MMAVYSLSSLARAFFALWALLLCLVNIIDALFALAQKRYVFSLVAVGLFAPVYLMWQVLFDLSLSGRTGTIAPLSQTLGGISWLWWALVFVFVTLGAALLLAYNVRYKKNFVTPGAIKLYLDKIPCGVCCWRDNGRVLFANVCMTRLCVALTDAPLFNGNHFRDAVASGILTVDGRRWRFACRDITVGGECVHEMIASDITAEYAKTQALERDKAELSRLNDELREYTLGIDDTVRRQEVLQAKVNIHDEMNRLMLSTMAAESEDAATLDPIFAMWQQNALLLCMQADKSVDKKAVERIGKLAAALHVRLQWSGLPSTLSEPQRALFFAAAQEAIANAAKHARATTMVISVDSTPTGVCCRFVNDGTMPTAPVPYRGGLANLVHLAAEQNATVAVQVGETFVLSVNFWV